MESVLKEKFLPIRDSMVKLTVDEGRVYTNLRRSIMAAYTQQGFAVLEQDSGFTMYSDREDAPEGAVAVEIQIHHDSVYLLNADGTRGERLCFEDDFACY